MNCILNYSASSEATDGATRFVAEDGLCSLCPEPGEAPTRPPQLNDPPEELYARERAVRYTAVRPAGILGCILPRVPHLLIVVCE